MPSQPANGRSVSDLAENLFDQHDKRAREGALRAADELPQPLQVLRRIVQAVDVIDPQALDLVLGDQAAHQAMDAFERLAILDAQSGKRVDVEEAPVVDVAARQPPVRQPVMLSLQQMMQRQRLRGAVLGAIGLETLAMTRPPSGDARKRLLELRRSFSVRIVWTAVLRARSSSAAPAALSSARAAATIVRRSSLYRTGAMGSLCS